MINHLLSGWSWRRTGQYWTYDVHSVVVSAGGAGLRRPLDVAMVQAADSGI
jgi:hypothetical protein